MRKCWLCLLMMSLPAFAQQTSNAAPAQAVQPADDQPPAHPITADQVHQLMNLTGIAKMQKQMLQGMMPTLRSSMPPYMPTDVLEDFQTSVLGPEMQTAIVRAYQGHLSEEDAAAVIAFYQTPAGQRMLAATPTIMVEMQAAGKLIGQQVMEEVLARHKAEIDAAKQKYEQSHPSSPPGS